MPGTDDPKIDSPQALFELFAVSSNFFPRPWGR